MRSKLLLFPIFLAIASLLACGGGSSNPGSGGKGGGGGGGGTSPTPVTVSSGNTTTGVNITVVAPMSSPAPNAKFLGVDHPQGLAFSTGDTVSRAQGNATVTMFGPGLATSMTVSVDGPNDITVGALSSVTAQDGTPGVQFPITLTGTTALGARTVVLKDSNTDITTFTGGLEVLP